MKFHEKLQELRKSRGMSQEALAELLDVSRQAVSKWESGQTYPETDKLIAISEYFGVSLDSLMHDGRPLEFAGSAYARGQLEPCQCSGGSTNIRVSERYSVCPWYMCIWVGAFAARKGF